MVGLVPVEAGFILSMSLLTFAGLVLLLVGLWHRVGGAVAVVGLFYIGWIPHLTGKVDHYHHVLWFALLVTVFPSADTWSLSSWLRGRRGSDPVRSEPWRYAVPVFAGVLLIALIYFFAGWAKFTTSGLEWAWSDNLRNIMYRLWWERGWIPELRLDRFPLGYRLVALGALAFELLFLPAVLIRRTRPFFVAAGVLFHVGTRLLLGISFTALLILYVVFFDWKRIVARLRRGEIEKDAPSGSLRLDAATAVAAGLVAVVAAFGALQRQDAWPIAAYPRFAFIETPVVHEIEFVTRDGEVVLLTNSGLARAFGSHQVKPMATVALLRGREDENALRSFMVLAAGHEPGVDEFCSLSRSSYSSIPGDGTLIERTPLFSLPGCLGG